MLALFKFIAAARSTLETDADEDGDGDGDTQQQKEIQIQLQVWLQSQIARRPPLSEAKATATTATRAEKSHNPIMNFHINFYSTRAPNSNPNEPESEREFEI